MRTSHRSLLSALLIAVGLAGLLNVGIGAQATLNSTTLSSAITSTTAKVINLTSASTVAVNQILVVDKEALLVTALSGTAASTLRGFAGTASATHKSGAVVFTGPNNYFSQADPGGACTTTDETALPRVVLPSASVYDCVNGEWLRYRLNGVPNASPGSPITYTSAGAITIKPGLSLIGSGGALAMTLAAPSRAQDGVVQEIAAVTAQAHTITVAGGVNGGSTATDVCTLGGAIGDGLVVRAWGGVWYLVSARNCTLG